MEYENDTLELGFSVFVISSQADEFESNVNNSQTSKKPNWKDHHRISGVELIVNFDYKSCLIESIKIIEIEKKMEEDKVFNFRDVKPTPDK